MKPTLALRSFLLGSAISASLAAPAAFAGNTWDGSGGSGLWNTGANWNADGIPGTGALIFAGNVQNSTSNDLAATDPTFAGIQFTNDGSGSNTNAFTLAGSRITLGGNITTTANTAGSTITDVISLNMILNANRTITTSQQSNTVQHNLTISGNISEDVAGRTLDKKGSGTLILSGKNTFTGLLKFTGAASGSVGTLTLSGDNINMTGGVTVVGTTGSVTSTVLNINSATALGTGTLTTTGANFTFDNTSGNDLTLTTNNAITLGTAIKFQGTKSLNMGTGAVTLGATARVIQVQANTLTLGGVISGIGHGITQQLTGTLALTNTNTYTGITNFQGVLEATVLADGGTNSSIGASTNAAANLVLNGSNAVLRYKGSSDVDIDRGFTLSGAAATNSTIESSGTGTLSFDNTVAISYGAADLVRSLTLGGTNAGANTFAKTFADNGTAANKLAKTGIGTWVLSGTNTYTGATNINEGTLVLSSTGSTHASSAVTVAAGTSANTPVAKLGGTGTIGGNVSLTTESAGTFKNGGVLAPTAAASGTALKVTGTTTFTTGSLFEWNMSATTPATDPGVVSNSGSYGQLAGTGAITGSDAVFNIALGAGNAFSDNFWNSNKSWTDVFTGAGATNTLASIFASFGGAGVDTAGVVTGQGSFTFTGTSTLNWTAVPEPTTALAGLLLTAGLLRRRRSA